MSTSIPFHSIIEGDRARNLKKYGDLGPLKDSIKEIGLIQPIVVSQRVAVDKENKLADPEGYVYDLIAGGRRYRAMKAMHTEALHHGVTLDPTRLGFIFQHEVPDHVRKEAELDENLHRLEMDWIDSALLIADIHDAKRAAAFADGKRWGLRQTSALLGKGFGKSNVNIALIAAKQLRAGDTEIMACESLTHAMQVILKRNEDKALAELQKRTLPKAAPSVMSGPLDSTASFLDTLNVSLTKKPIGGDPTCIANTDSSGPTAQHAKDNSTPAIASPAATKVQPSVAAEKVRVPLSTMFKLGDFRNLLRVDVVQVDHIVTDIPYGIDMDNLDEKQVASVKAEHNVEENVALMPEFLQLSYRALRPGGFCVFFYDLDHHEKLQGWAKDVGFRVQRWPFVAVKTSPCQNNAAAYNLTKNYEVAMFLRKDEKSVLRHDPKFTLNNSSWKEYNFKAERDLYSNPFAKPFQLWKDIYDMISFPGQSVLDPFCGEMSACRAAANCGLVPYGIEINEKHYNRGLEHMKAVYALIHKGNVEFV